jgi:hypothetical protein
MAAMIRGMVKSLGGKGRHYDDCEKAFYSMLLTWGGPLVAMFVSMNLNGPCLTTIRQYRRAQFKFGLVDLDGNLLQVRMLRPQFICCMRACMHACMHALLHGSLQ